MVPQIHTLGQTRKHNPALSFASSLSSHASQCVLQVLIIQTSVNMIPAKWRWGFSLNISIDWKGVNVSDHHAIGTNNALSQQWASEKIRRENIDWLPMSNLREQSFKSKKLDVIQPDGILLPLRYRPRGHSAHWN
jgi:hypothetical protein